MGGNPFRSRERGLDQSDLVRHRGPAQAHLETIDIDLGLRAKSLVGVDKGQVRGQIPKVSDRLWQRHHLEHGEPGAEGVGKGDARSQGIIVAGRRCHGKQQIVEHSGTPL